MDNLENHATGASHSTIPNASPISDPTQGSNMPAIKRKPESQEPITSRDTSSSLTPLLSRDAKRSLVCQEPTLNLEEELENKQETIVESQEDGTLQNTDPFKVIGTWTKLHHAQPTQAFLQRNTQSRAFADYAQFLHWCDALYLDNENRYVDSDDD